MCSVTLFLNELYVLGPEAARGLVCDVVVCVCVCCRERGVWLGLSDQYSPRVLRWVDGSEVRTGEEGTRDRATLQPGKVCVSLDGSGQPSSHSCTAKRAFVCQFTRQGKQHRTHLWTLQLQSADLMYCLVCVN